LNGASVRRAWLLAETQGNSSVRRRGASCEGDRGKRRWKGSGRGSRGRGIRWSFLRLGDLGLVCRLALLQGCLSEFPISDAGSISKRRGHGRHLHRACPHHRRTGSGDCDDGGQAAVAFYHFVFFFWGVAHAIGHPPGRPCTPLHPCPTARQQGDSQSGCHDVASWVAVASWTRVGVGSATRRATHGPRINGKVYAMYSMAAKRGHSSTAHPAPATALPAALEAARRRRWVRFAGNAERWSRAMSRSILVSAHVRVARVLTTSHLVVQHLDRASLV
jgi:hypothetical protein